MYTHICPLGHKFLSPRPFHHGFDCPECAEKYNHSREETLKIYGTHSLSNIEEKTMIKKIDVTDQVDFQGNDDKLLPITKCVCGAKFEPWTFTIGVYDDDPYECPKCGAKLYFSWSVTVYKIEDEREK